MIIAHGYSTLISEVCDQLINEHGSQFDQLTHVFLQVGAGLFAGGMVHAMMAYAKSTSTKLPKIVAVEARGAHCFFLSMEKGDGGVYSKQKLVQC